MALETEISSLITEQLNKRLRYRCLIIQSRDLVMLSKIYDIAILAVSNLGDSANILRSEEMFDNIGAYSCNKVLTLIESVAVVKPLILTGPLHFLDYWSEQLCNSFWEYMSCFTHGPGIILLDAVRSKSIEGSFQVLGKINGTDIRYLKSRLALSEVNYI